MAMTASGIGLNGSCPAHPTQIAPIRRAVSDAARRCGASQETLTRLELAVTEATTNVVLHAYREPAQAGRIHVAAALAGGVFEVAIRDDGVGMSPNPKSPGLGMGLSLMAHEADACEIRTPDAGGTEVLMRFAVGTSGRGTPRRSTIRGGATRASERYGLSPDPGFDSTTGRQRSDPRSSTRPPAETNA